MYNLKISAITIISLLVLTSFNSLGIEHHLYLDFWFYDIIAHILGGIGIAMSVYCIAIVFNISCIKDNLWKIVFLTFLAGLAWEVFEVYYDIAGHPFGSLEYNIDTIKDLIDDTLGGILVWYLLKKNK